MKQVDELTFPNGHQAKMVRIQAPQGSARLKFLNSDISPYLQSQFNVLGLQYPNPTLVLVGGAGGISAEAMEQLRSLFSQVLAPLAERLGLTVVDGGTDAGVMKLMGDARRHIQGTFPLIGVVVEKLLILPDQASNEEGAAPEPHHTHFMLVPGAMWGDESPWIARVATALAGQRPSLTVLVNGGGITFHDAENSQREKRLVLVLGGSGRTADVLAAAVQGDRSNDQANRILQKGFLQVVDLFTPVDNLHQVFETYLNPVMPLN